MTTHAPEARAAIRSFTAGFYRSISGAVIAHMPDATASSATHDACRTMCVGVLAEAISRLIQCAPDHPDKGGRVALRRLAHDLVNTTPEPAGDPGKEAAP